MGEAGAVFLKHGGKSGLVSSLEQPKNCSAVYYSGILFGNTACLLCGKTAAYREGAFGCGVYPASRAPANRLRLALAAGIRVEASRRNFFAVFGSTVCYDVVWRRAGGVCCGVSADVSNGKRRI